MKLPATNLSLPYKKLTGFIYNTNTILNYIKLT